MKKNKVVPKSSNDPQSNKSGESPEGVESSRNKLKATDPKDDKKYPAAAELKPSRKRPEPERKKQGSATALPSNSKPPERTK